MCRKGFHLNVLMQNVLLVKESFLMQIVSF